MPPPLGRVGTPLTLKPSSLASMRTPRPFSEVVTVSIRSVSLTRSSAAPRTIVSPRAIPPDPGRGERRRPNLQIGDGLAARRPPVEDRDVRAHAFEHV